MVYYCSSTQTGVVDAIAAIRMIAAALRFVFIAMHVV